MTKPIPRQVHGAVDYLYAATAAAAPDRFEFRDEPTAARLIRLAAGGVAAYSLLTRYEWGVLRVLPWRSHLAVDVVAGVATMAAPWLFGFARHAAARNTFLAMGAFSVAAGLLAETDEMPADGR
ncbi:MAG: hypothetical protein K2X82_23410 [Gemmataceae bacterium]|nr:hypothetical protein [Gemmataceae bacterium]